MHDAPAFQPVRSKPGVMDAEQWMVHLFSARAAIKGGVVRRNVQDVERVVGWSQFRKELQRRGFSAVVNGGQVVVFCNAEPVHLLD